MIVLRYQVGQEKNYETKDAMKTGGGERTLYRKKATRRKELQVRHTLGEKPTGINPG